MQKKLKSLLALASLAVAGAIFFLACGKDDSILFDIGDIDQGAKVLGENIGDGSIYEGYSQPSESSSSESKPSSSSQNTTPSSASVSSSSQNTTPSSASEVSSSSSQNTTPSSASVVSSSSRPVSSSSKPVQQSNGCGETNKKSGFTCDWSKTSNLAPGVKITPTQTGKGDCEIAWSFAKGDQKPVNEMELTYGCESLNESEGVITEGSKTYALFAKLTCSDGTHINKCANEVTAGAAPYLEGTCKWSKTPTTTARGAVPSGVSLVDTDKICGSTKPPVVYKYDNGSKTWPTEGGPLPEIHRRSGNRSLWQSFQIRCCDNNLPSIKSKWWRGSSNYLQ